MRIIAFLCALFLTASMVDAEAGEPKLSGEQITQALSGKTATGEQGENSWKQYFAPNGDTVYVDASGKPSPGKWKVEGDTYCSLWPPTPTWDCYDMTGEADRVNWIAVGGGDPWPAQMLEGNQLDP